MDNLDSALTGVLIVGLGVAAFILFSLWKGENDAVIERNNYANWAGSQQPAKQPTNDITPVVNFPDLDPQKKMVQV